MHIRQYKTEDYSQLKALYQQGDLYGGQFDENRDSSERLQKRIEADPDAILIAEENDRIIGTISLIEDGRVAWLFRFVVMQNENEAEIAEALSTTALATLKAKGHSQVLVYTPSGKARLDNRYENLGFTRGGDYTCYWKDIA